MTDLQFFIQSIRVSLEVLGIALVFIILVLFVSWLTSKVIDRKKKPNGQI